MPVQMGSLFLLDFNCGLIRKVVGFVVGQDEDRKIHSLPLVDDGNVMDEDDSVVSSLNHGSPFYEDMKDAWIECWNKAGDEDDFLAYVKQVGLPIIHGMKSPL